MKAKAGSIVFFTIIGVLYAWALSESVLSATILDVSTRQLFLYCAVIVVALNVMFWGKYTAIISMWLLILAGGALLVYMYTQDFQVAWFMAVRQDIEAIVEFLRGQSDEYETFARLAALGVSLLFAIVTVLNTRLHFGFFSLTFMAAGVIALPILGGWDRSDEAIVVALFCLLTLLSKKLHLNTLRGQLAQGRYALMLLPLCMLIFGVGWVLPKPSPETLESVSLPTMGVMEDWMHAITPDQTITFTQDGRRLGGPVVMNDFVVMVVEAEERLYLAGAVRDYYTGYAWLSTERARQDLSEGEDGVFDIYTGLEARRRMNDFLRRWYGWPVREVTISTMDVRTDTIFVPPFAQTLELDHPGAVSQDAYGMLRSGRVMTREVSYTQSYIAWDHASPHFALMLRDLEFIRRGTTGITPDGRDVTHITQQIGALGGQIGLTQAELEPFLQLPDSLPDRVVSLARELTDWADNNYDKLRSLESFLASFPYTLNAAVLPEGEDFVDHFLFTGREGYCVHFATAMVVMSRAVGIPTRYVEGFIMPERVAGDGRFWVTNRQAHAWVEAYFEGMGWVTFEPTPTYHIGAGGAAPEYEQAPAPTPQPSPEPTPQPAPPAQEPPAEPPQAPEQEEDAQGGFPWAAAIIILAMLGGGYLAYRLLIARYLAKQRKLEGLDNREAVLALFASTLSAAGACGRPIAQGETAFAYAGRTELDPLMEGVDMGLLAVVYSKAAYSEHEVSEWERAAAKESRDKILRRLTASAKNLPRYWVGRYLLLKY